MLDPAFLEQCLPDLLALGLLLLSLAAPLLSLVQVSRRWTRLCEHAGEHALAVAHRRFEEARLEA